MVKIVLTLLPGNQWKIEYPLDKPLLTINGLEGGLAAVKQQGLAKEMKPAVQQTSATELVGILCHGRNGAGG